MSADVGAASSAELAARYLTTISTANSCASVAFDAAKESRVPGALDLAPAATTRTTDAVAPTEPHAPAADLTRRKETIGL